MKTIPACLMLLLLAAAGHAAEPLDLTTGREVTVPVEVHGSYQLVAANGRVLAAGTADGCPAFYLAALKPGASEQVDLIADNIKQPLLLHSPRPLAGLKARFDLRPALRRTLLDAGLSAAESVPSCLRTLCPAMGTPGSSCCSRPVRTCRWRCRKIGGKSGWSALRFPARSASYTVKSRKQSTGRDAPPISNCATAAAA